MTLTLRCSRRVALLMPLIQELKHQVTLRRAQSILVVVERHNDLSLQSRIPTVLDRVVSTAGHLASDLCPLIAERPVRLDDRCVLLEGPLVLLDSWVEMVVPAFSALLPDAVVEVGRDHTPVSRPVLEDHRGQQVVLLWGSGTFAWSSGGLLDPGGGSSIGEGFWTLLARHRGLEVE